MSQPTLDDFRATYRKLYPRPGWRVRNLEADHGRCFDFEHFRREQALVDWDWDEQRVEGWLGGVSIYEEGRARRPAVVRAMEAVEAELVKRWDELHEASG